MSSSSEPMKLPLRYDDGKFVVRDANNRFVCDLSDSDFVDDVAGMHGHELAIARNCHPAMLAALEYVAAGLERRTDDPTNLPKDLKAMLLVAQTALNEAKGGAS